MLPTSAQVCGTNAQQGHSELRVHSGRSIVHTEAPFSGVKARRAVSGVHVLWHISVHENSLIIIPSEAPFSRAKARRTSPSSTSRMLSMKTA